MNHFVLYSMYYVLYVINMCYVEVLYLFGQFWQPILYTLPPPRGKYRINEFVLYLAHGRGNLIFIWCSWILLCENRPLEIVGKGKTNFWKKRTNSIWKINLGITIYPLWSYLILNILCMWYHDIHNSNWNWMSWNIYFHISYHH